MANRRRSAAGVSPDRTATSTSGGASPEPARGLRGSRSAARAGCARRRPRAPSAGDTYSTRQRSFGSSGGGVVASRSSAQRNAASVLPDPVGATTSASRPAVMASHASSWAGVAASKTSPNHARVAGENRLNALVFFTSPILPGPADSFRISSPLTRRFPSGADVVPIVWNDRPHDEPRTCSARRRGLSGRPDRVRETRRRPQGQLERDRLGHHEDRGRQAAAGVQRPVARHGPPADRGRDQADHHRGRHLQGVRRRQYVGSNCTFESVPFDKMGSSSGDGVSFRKDGDKIMVTVKDVDLGQVCRPAASPR